MPIQVVVSPETGGVQEMFIWDENNPMQACVGFQADSGTWHAYLEHKENESGDTMDLPLGSDYVLVGYFPTLHAALNELSAPPYEGAPVAQFSGTVYGEVVVG